MTLVHQHTQREWIVPAHASQSRGEHPAAQLNERGREQSHARHKTLMVGEIQFHIEKNQMQVSDIFPAFFAAKCRRCQRSCLFESFVRAGGNGFGS